MSKLSLRLTLVALFGALAGCGGIAEQEMYIAEPINGSGSPSETENGEGEPLPPEGEQMPDFGEDAGSSSTEDAGMNVDSGMPTDAGMQVPDAGTPVEVGPKVRAAGLDLVSKLTDAGVDLDNLPPIAELPAKAKSAVMNGFTQSLGVGCTHCHSPDFNFKTVTPKMKVTNRMWSVFVQGMRFNDGSKLFCDSCHQGKAVFLTRPPEAPSSAFSGYMRSNYVTPFSLKSPTGGNHGCGTCHNNASGMFTAKFLDAWAQ